MVGIGSRQVPERGLDGGLGEAHPRGRGPAQLSAERRRLALRDLDQRGAAYDPISARELVDQLVVRLAPAADPREIRADVRPLQRVRRAVGHEQGAVHPTAPAPLPAAAEWTPTVDSCTKSTSRRNTSVSVWGSTPWPRLNTCPRRPS